MAEAVPNPVSTLGVVGAGTMGHGIAQTAILAGVGPLKSAGLLPRPEVGP